MRILQVVHFLPPRHMAGVEIYTQQLAQSLARDHEVGLFTTEIRREAENYRLERSEIPEGPDAAAITVYEVVHNHWFRSFEETYRNEAMRAPIREVLDDFDPQIAHVQHLLGHSIVLLEELERRGVPFVMTAHDHWLDCAAGGQRFHRRLGRCEAFDSMRCGECMAHMSAPALRARDWLEQRHLRRERAGSAVPPGAATRPGETAGGPVGRKGVARSLASAALPGLRRIGSRVLRVPVPRMAQKMLERRSRVLEAVGAAALLLAPSRFMETDLLRIGLDAKRIRYLEHGFPGAPPTEPRAMPIRARHFGFVGSLVRHKGVHLLLEAFEGLPHDATLEIAGWPGDDPAYMAELERITHHPGVSFLGRQDREQVEALLARLDCLVAPSIWTENAPLVVSEALLAGLPVIASRLGGHVEALEGGGGLLYEAESIAELRSALLGVYREEGRLAEIGRGARRVVPMAEHCDALVGIYAEVLAAAR